MALPIRTTLEDVDSICGYLASKPTGAKPSEAKAVIDERFLDARKLNALKLWGLIDEATDGKLKVTPQGREYAKKNGPSRVAILQSVIRKIPAYSAIIERLAHRNEDSITATDVAAHWHQHFKDDASGSDRILNDQAVCFFQVAVGAEFGTLIVGRKGAPTRFEANKENSKRFANSEHGTTPDINDSSDSGSIEKGHFEEKQQDVLKHATPSQEVLGQAIFVAHGKNKKPLEQLRKILDQFKIPFKVAVDEPNLGRPIGTKVREIMKACNCAILIFTADEEFTNKAGETIWRPSENVVFELGASGYLYDNRIVIMKEDTVDFPTNFRDLGYITFTKDQLEAKAMEILKELIGFGIVKVST